MKLDGIDLLFGDEAPSAQTVQAAPSQPQRIDGLNLLMGDDALAAPQQAQPARPQSPGFWSDPVGTVSRAVRGVQDPAYKGVPEYISTPEAAAGGPFNAMLASKVLGSSDEAYGDIIAKQIGPNLMRRERDANGYEVMVYRGQDGQEKKAYVNTPGLGLEDVNRAAFGVLPYLGAGKVVQGITGGAKVVQGAAQVAKQGWSTLNRMLAQGAGAGATSVATNVAEAPLGSEQGIDPVRAGIAAAGGVIGEGIATGLGQLAYTRRLGQLIEPDGTLTKAGQDAARAAGIAPDELAGEAALQFAKAYALTPKAAEAAVKFRSANAMDIPSTVGQRTKDVSQLLEEKGMRYGLYGENAKNVMQDFDRRQAGAIENQVRGYIDIDQNGTQTLRGVGGRIAPNRAPGDSRPDVLGSSIRTGLEEAQQAERAIERQAWEKVPDMVPMPKAFEDLPTAITGQLGARRVDDKVTPTAWRMAEELDAYMTGKAITPEGPKVLNQTPIRTIDEMRRRLLSVSKSATEGEDKAAATAIYNGFNDWIDTAAEKALLSGSPEAAAALRTARSVTKEIRDLFGLRDSSGRFTAGARILKNVMERADSPESIVSQLFGSGGPGAAPKQGTLEALQQLKTILTRQSDREAKALSGNVASGANDVWGDVRLAYWVRLTQDRAGNVLSPTMLKKNIEQAMQSQSSVLRELYTKPELAEIRRLAHAVGQVSWKDPNPSGTASAAGFYARQFLQNLFGAFGLNTKLGQAAIEYSGLNRALGTAKARSAVQQAVPRPQNSLLAPYPAAAAAQNQRDVPADQR